MSFNDWVKKGEVGWLIQWAEIIANYPYLADQKEKLEEILLEIREIRRRIVFITTLLPEEPGFSILLSLIMSIATSFISILPLSPERNKLIEEILKLLHEMEKSD